MFFDCDGTLTKIKSSWEHIHRGLGIWENNADEYQRLFREGRIGYGEFCRRDALLWKGLVLKDVVEMVGQIPYQEGSKEVITELKGLGIFTVILSTGLSFLVDKVRDDLGIHMSLSNELLTKGGFLTGEARINVEYEQKGPWVEKILSIVGMVKSEACAVGDGEGDRGMFDAVDLSIGFHPHPSIQSHLSRSIMDGSLAGVLDIIKGHSLAG